MNGKIQIVIVDDEPDAIEYLSALIREFVDDAVVAGTAHSALEGIKIIRQVKPDLVLLDIDMPGGTGFDMLDALPEKRFKVIFTTASSEHSLKALKAKVEDYLLKPVDTDELCDAVAHVRQQKNKAQAQEAPRIPLPEHNGYTYVLVKDIIHLNGEGNYTTVFYEDNKKAVISKSIKYFEELLQPYHFFRCHQSHLVNPQQVKQLKKDEGTYLVMSNGNRIDVSRAHREAVLSLLNGV